MINDPHFRVVLDKDGSSPNPQVAIWRGQHQCVIEGFSMDDPAPSPQRCGEIIIKHQLQGDRGHYSVLDQAFIKLDCQGFPHSVLAQITRHRDSAFLVQSSRYTGQRFIDVAEGRMKVEEAFYFRPLGHYTDREGKRYEYKEWMLSNDHLNCIQACKVYKMLVQSEGFSEEHARDVIPYNFRQNFTIACTLKNFFHVLDQRSAKCSQLEIQAWARMACDTARPWAPEVIEWYEKHRYSRARLAP